LLLANFGKQGGPQPITTPITQETLAEIIGTTRSRVGVANDNGVVMQEPRAPLFTETVPGHDLTVVAWRGKPHLLRTKGKPRWLTTRRSR